MAQAPGLVWDKSYDIGYYTKFKDIKQTSDNGYIVCGSCSEEATSLYDDILLLKINSDGNTAWTKRIGELKSSEYASSVLVTEDQGFLIAGQDLSATLW